MFSLSLVILSVLFSLDCCVSKKNYGKYDSIADYYYDDINDDYLQDGSDDYQDGSDDQDPTPQVTPGYYRMVDTNMEVEPGKNNIIKTFVDHNNHIGTWFKDDTDFATAWQVIVVGKTGNEYLYNLREYGGQYRCMSLESIPTAGHRWMHVGLKECNANNNNAKFRFHKVPSTDNRFTILSYDGQNDPLLGDCHFTRFGEDNEVNDWFKCYNPHHQEPRAIFEFRSF